MERVPILFALLTQAGCVSQTGKAPSLAEVSTIDAPTKIGWARVELMRGLLLSEVGPYQYEIWFRAMDVEQLRNSILTVSVPAKPLKFWIDENYSMPLLRAAHRAEASIESVEVVVRSPKRDV